MATRCGRLKLFMENRVEIEMSISLKDFYRLLPIALKNYDFQIKNNIINIDNGKIEIRPGVEKTRSIASLKFPILKVLFLFLENVNEDKNSFMENFRRVYQKGGG